MSKRCSEPAGMETPSPRQRRPVVCKNTGDSINRPLISSRSCERQLRRVQSLSSRTTDGGTEVKKLRKSPQTASTSSLSRIPLPPQKGLHQQATVKTIIDKARLLRKNEQELLINLKQEISSLRVKAQKANEDAEANGDCIKREFPSIPGPCCLRSCLAVLSLKGAEDELPLSLSPVLSSSPITQSPRSIGFPSILPMEELLSFLESIHDDLGCELVSNSPRGGSVVDSASNYKKLLETISCKDKRITDLVTSLTEMEQKTSSSSSRLEEEMKTSSSYKEMNDSQSELIALLKCQLSASEEGLCSERAERENLAKQMKEFEDEKRRLLITVNEQDVKFKSAMLEKDAQNMKKLLSMKELLDSEIAAKKVSESYCSQLKQDVEAKDKALSSYAERLTDSLHKCEISSNRIEDLTSKFQASMDRENHTAAQADKWKCKFEELEESVRPFREHLENLAKEKGILVEQNEEIFSKLSSASLVLASAMGHQNPKQKIKYLVKIQEELSEVKKENALLHQVIAKKPELRALTPSRKKPSTPGKSG